MYLSYASYYDNLLFGGNIDSNKTQRFSDIIFDKMLEFYNNNIALIICTKIS